MNEIGFLLFQNSTIACVCVWWKLYIQQKNSSTFYDLKKQRMCVCVYSFFLLGCYCFFDVIIYYREHIYVESKSIVLTFV